jgi:hypothetical protein
MNSAGQFVDEDQLLASCLEHLRDLPFVRRAKILISKGNGQPSSDGQLSIATATGTTKLPCEIKRAHLRQESAQLLIHIGKNTPGLTVLAPTVGRELGDAFEHAGLNFIDAAGNCHIKLGDRYLARIQGRAALPRAQIDRAFRAPAYRVLFVLLARPALIDATSRAIAGEAGVSPQTANDLRRRLVERGFVLATKKRHMWAPKRFQDARAFWLSGFSASLAPSLMLGRFRAKESDPAELELRLEPQLDALCDWRYGGGAACMRLTGFYRGSRTVLYIRDPAIDMFKQLKLTPDRSGPIVFMRAPGQIAFESPEPRSVHPLLTYADLSADSDERAREAAGELYDRFLQGHEPRS